MLTSTQLRKAADSLHAGDYTVGGNTFICLAVAPKHSPERDEIEALMVEAGIPTLSGRLFEGVELSRESREFREYYANNAQPVRFMLLEFLAHLLEDGSDPR
jgi:hypothetical protein